MTSADPSKTQDNLKQLRTDLETVIDQVGRITEKVTSLEREIQEIKETLKTSQDKESKDNDKP